MSIFGVVIILLINIVLMLVLTIIIASLTLIERKFLALVQRRVGPNFVGYKGRLQYIADALKLFVKGALIPDESNRFLFVTIPSIAVAICYSFWMNGIWGPSISLFEIEYNMVYVSLFSVLFGMCVILTGYFSKNKYAMLAAVRTGIGMLNLELFLGLMILNVILLSESFSFLPLVIYQENYWFILVFFLLSGLITITFLLETNRAPFDLPEAESELVTGYTTEYGGFFFGLYYLGEYLHLFFFSLIISIIFFGGWELPNFFLNFFVYYYDLNNIVYILLDWLSFFNNFFNLWWPWINLLNELFLIQFLIFYIIYLIYSTNNLYFLLFYVFISFFYLGIFLCIFNLELFTAFLWLAECVIVFVSILFLFYLNVYGNVNKNNNVLYSFKYYGLFVLFLIFIFNINYCYEMENVFDLNIFFFWDDYYESLFNNKMNDLFGLYISYYYINSFEFIIIGLLLLIASLVAVNLNKFNRNLKSNNYYELVTLFDFFDDFVKFLFMKKQNLTDQNINNPSTRVFKKKVKK